MNIIIIINSNQYYLSLTNIVVLLLKSVFIIWHYCGKSVLTMTLLLAMKSSMTSIIDRCEVVMKYSLINDLYYYRNSPTY